MEAKEIVALLVQPLSVLIIVGAAAVRDRNWFKNQLAQTVAPLSERVVRSETTLKHVVSALDKIPASIAASAESVRQEISGVRQEISGARQDLLSQSEKISSLGRELSEFRGEMKARSAGPTSGPTRRVRKAAP